MTSQTGSEPLDRSNDGAATRTRKIAVPLGITIIVAIALGTGAWLFRNAAHRVNEIALADTPKGVTAVKARRSTFRERRRYVGTLEAWLEANVGPQLASGFVDTVLVRPGSIVQRGAVLATLDCRNASAANRSIAMQARALQEREKAASREAARMAELLAGGYAAPNEVEQKQGQAAATAAQIEALLAQASGKALEVNDCVLRAPFVGEVSTRYVDPGSFVRPGAPVVEVVDRSIVRVTADVPEIDFDAVAPNTAVALRVMATNARIDGRISRRSPKADPATRTVHVEIDVPDPERRLPIGTTAEIFVDVGEPKPTSEIPLSAAKIRGSSASIFTIENDVAQSKTVTVIGERESSIFVDPKDLAAGTPVVTEGRGLLANGDKVLAKIKDANSSDAAPNGATTSDAATNDAANAPTQRAANEAKP